MIYAGQSPHDISGHLVMWPLETAELFEARALSGQARSLSATVHCRIGTPKRAFYLYEQNVYFKCCILSFVALFHGKLKIMLLVRKTYK